jgi:hypothetical protein
MEDVGPRLVSMRSKARFLASQPGLISSLFTSIIVAFVCLTKIFQKIVSPWDELYHLAYVQYMYNFKIPQPGDELLSWSKYAFSCFPVHPFGFTTALNCGAEGPPEAFPELGRNVAAIWPPLHYGMSSIWMRVFGASDETSLFAARSFSAIAWSFGAGLFCYALISRNKLSKESAISISLLAAIFPMGIFQSVFVTPYCLALGLVSILYLFATSPKLMSTRGLVNLVIVATLSILTIPHILPVIFFFTLRILFQYWDKNVAKSRVTFFTITCTTTVPVAAITFWQNFQESRRLPVDTAIQPSTPFSLDQIPRSLFTFIPHSIDGYQFLNHWQFLISYILSIIFLALVFKPLVEQVSPRSNKVDTFLLLTISCIFGVIEHMAFGIIIPPRYGLPIIFVSFLVITRSGISITIEWAVKILALVGLMSALLSPVFGASA